MNKYQGAGIAAHTYDLSTGGARIVTSKSFAVGSVMRVRIDLNGKNLLFPSELNSPSRH